MQYYWLNQKNNDKLTVFFGGWSFDYRPFNFLDCGNNDVIIFYDYNDLSFKIEFQRYKEVNLIAWSMGVFTAYLLKDKLPEFNNKIAVNGTPYPINDEWGIPIKTFDLTLKHVDAGLAGKFYKNIFSTTEEFEIYMLSPIERPIINRASELEQLNELIKNTDVNYTHFYDKAIISSNDKIIPVKNQFNFWENNNVKIVPLESGHFPYYNYKSWDEILLCK